jgi:twinkle protein
MYYDKLTDLGIKLTRRHGQEKTLCPKCSAGRKNKTDKCLSVNITTGEYNCKNSCGFVGNVRSYERPHNPRIEYKKPDQSIIKQILRKDKTVAWFKQRGITEKTLERFLIFNKEEWMPQTGKAENCICFPYLRDTEVVNVKFRDAKKNFRMVKEAELIFFNINSMVGKKKVIITEGEIDAMSVWQCGFGQNLNPVQNPDKEGEVIETADPLSEYGVVSVPNGAALGANKKLEYLDNCADWFVGLDEIIIATDGDAAGIDLRDELIRRLGVERCKYVIYPKDASVSDSNGGTRPPKDMNEVLVWLGAEKVVELALNAFQVPVDGIYYVDDIFESMFESFKAGIQLAPTTRMGTLDDYFRWKKGDQNCWTGYANYGKTTYVLQLMLTKSIFDHWRWAIYSPENYPANDFYDDLIEMYCGKDLSQMTQEEYVDAATFINEHFFYVYPDHEHDLNAIHEKFRYLILKKGVDGVLVDPWNQLDHNMSGYQREDIYLSRAFKDTKRFALMNHIVYNIIAHPKNPTPRQDGSIDAADMYDLSGGSMWGNKMDGIISYHRPDHHADKSSSRCELHIQKVKRKRTGGKQGVVEYNHIWSRRRFEDTLTGKIYCDPNMVGKMPQLPQGELNLEKQYTPLSMEGF